MAVGLGVFFRDAEVQAVREEDEAVVRDLQTFDLVVDGGVQDIVLVYREPPPEMDVIEFVPRNFSSKGVMTMVPRSISSRIFLSVRIMLVSRNRCLSPRRPPRRDRATA